MTTDPLFAQVVPSDGTGSENRRGGTGSRFRPPIGGNRGTGTACEAETTHGGSVSPSRQTTLAGFEAYATARKLDKLAQGPLERLAELWTCEECHAPVGRPCEASEGPHAARLEEAAAGRAEWIALRSPDGRAWARVWDRRVARSAARSALWKAAQGLEGAETNDTRPDDREGQQTAAEAEEMDR